MKISLFIKSYTTKASSLFIAILLMAGSPVTVDASFFSNITAMVLGSEATADEMVLLENNGTTLNSQTVPLLESFASPDAKNAIDIEDEIIVQDDSFIYSNGPIGADVTFEKSSISDKINVYTVKEGDTLSEIAEIFDVSMNTIRWENNFSGSTVSIGQKLNILPVTGVKHIVKSGDTISRIADKYEAESEDIFIFNDISKESVLKQGDIIFVPNGIKTVTIKTSTTSVPGTTAVSNTKVQSGYYTRPVSGVITSSYGSRRGGFHYGVDIGNARGTPVSAAAPGTVIKVVTGCVEGKKSCGGRYGNYIIIGHSNGTETTYAHLSKVLVGVGSSVSRGQKIGTLGNTGSSTGPHVHFEITNANGSKMRPAF